MYFEGNQQREIERAMALSEWLKEIKGCACFSRNFAAVVSSQAYV